MLAQDVTDEKSITINIRATRRQRDLIDRAAQATEKNRSEFMLESACKAALDTLLDQRYFSIDSEQFARFIEALDAPPQENAKLKALVSGTPPWGK